MTKQEAADELIWIRDELAQTEEEYEALTIAIRELEGKDDTDGSNTAVKDGGSNEGCHNG